MKKGTIKTGIKSLAGAAMMALVISACNNEQSSSSTANTNSEVTPDTTVAAPVTKKKGKASATKATEDATAKVVKDKDGVYTKVEVAPVYPGNDQALTDYIAANIVYPEQAIDGNVEGTVNVQFVVDDKGEISNVTTIGNKLGYGLEEEAVNVVSKLPKWEPGKVKGKSVKTKLTVPITYKLES